MLSRYESLLSSSPLLTKSITAGFITAFGDVLSQLLEAHLAPSKIPFSLVRLGAFLLAGTFFIGPFMTYWFEVLWSIGRRLPKSWSKRSVTLTQVLVDQTAGVALFFPAFFFCYELCESLASGRPRFPTLAVGKIRNDLPAILVNQYKLWPLANFVSFSFVPVRYRVLYSNVMAVFWNIYLCAAVAAG
ncbi:hypothetical protein TeGR_g3930 [Tetraparma gracilis]|uniref:Uncharacterized protein n=1 Tax=Tetraparma gracilis TaxID=2962635 RepID=A0ABQ6MFG0_9STRA|nr:hypothetical protein TeGR_g3930 [Tetraparma gracilis]